jgi:hypothetical protein
VARIARRALSIVTAATLPCFRCLAYSRKPAVKMCSSPLPVRDLLELWYSSFRSPPFQNSFSNGFGVPDRALQLEHLEEDLPPRPQRQEREQQQHRLDDERGLSDQREE